MSKRSQRRDRARAQLRSASAAKTDASGFAAADAEASPFPAHASSTAPEGLSKRAPLWHRAKTATWNFCKRENRGRLRAGLAGSSFALIFGCGTNAISSSGDMNIALAQIAVGTIFAFALIGLLDEKPLKKLLYCVSVLLCFSIIGFFVYRQASAKQIEDEARKTREDKQASELSAVSDRLKYALKELDEQKTWRQNEDRLRILRTNPAQLVPGDDQSVLGRCRGTGVVNVLLGSTSYGSTQFPFIAVAVNKKPAIVVDRDEDGRPLVSFIVNDKNGKLLARVDKNEVFVPAQFATLMPRKDLQHLDVIDTNGDSVLSAYFANKNTIIFSGVFYRDGRGFRLDGVSEFGPIRTSGGSVCGSKIGVSLE